MLRFRAKNIVPPGGKYFYAIEREGQPTIEFEAYSYNTMITTVKNYYRANDMQIPVDLSAQIEDYICRRVPGSFCLGSDDGKPRAKVVTLQGLRKQAHDTAMPYRGRFVEVGVAERRALVCASCEFNDRTACPTCVGLVAWGEKFVGGLKTSYNSYLGVCAKDTLLLPVKVFLPQTPPCEEEMPDFCWVRR